MQWPAQSTGRSRHHRHAGRVLGCVWGFQPLQGQGVCVRVHACACASARKRVWRGVLDNRRPNAPMAAFNDSHTHTCSHAHTHTCSHAHTKTNTHKNTQAGQVGEAAGRPRLHKPGIVILCIAHRCERAHVPACNPCMYTLSPRHARANRFPPQLILVRSHCTGVV